MDSCMKFFVDTAEIKALAATGLARFVTDWAKTGQTIA